MGLYTIVQNKVQNFIRLIFAHSLTIVNGSVLVMEYPKSGGTWLSQLIAAYFDLPLPRNTMPSLRKSVVHGHYLPNNLFLRNKPLVFLIRDGRDVMVSLYYHQLIWHEKNKLKPKDVLYHRANVPFDDYDQVEKNMAAFIQYTFQHQPSVFQHFTYMGNWYEYNLAWLKAKERSNDIHFVRYEDLLNQPFETLSNLFQIGFGQRKTDEKKLKMVIERFSFKNQTKRRQGEENKSSFLRKGIHGDWKNYFGAEEKQLFKSYTKDLLVKFGYEENMDW